MDGRRDAESSAVGKPARGDESCGTKAPRNTMSFTQEHRSKRSRAGQPEDIVIYVTKRNTGISLP